MYVILYLANGLAQMLAVLIPCLSFQFLQSSDDDIICSPFAAWCETHG